MFRFYYILLLGFTSFLLAGCPSSTPENIPIWEQTKIGDLVPRVTAEPNQQLSDMINLDIYIFEISAEDANIFDNIWSLLDTQPLRFNDYDAFCANLFAAGFSEASAWDPLGEILRSGNAKRAERDSLILLNNRPRDITVTAVDATKTIFYTSASARSEGITLGPGLVVLRIKTQKIIGQRGVCNLSIQPIFLPLRESRNRRSKEGDKEIPFVFDALGFRLKISPGDLFLLGPKKYTTDQAGLAACFFSREKPRPIVRLYVFVCGEIAD